MLDSPQPFQVIVKSSKKLEELEQLELSEKKKKVDELQKELNTIKTQTPKLFEELRNEIEKLTTQIEEEANTVTAITKHHTTISKIITKIEDPKIYEQFLKDQREIEEQIIKTKKQEKITLSANSENDNTAISTIITTVENPKIYKQFLKDQDDPIEAIITKILAEDPGIDSQFKKLFEDDPDSIKKIITEIVKENAIKKIITEIKDAPSKGSEAEGDEFEKIIAKILQEDSLITKYYKKEPYSITGIIDQLQHEKADENPIEKITTQILSEKEKAFKAIAEDPLGQIIIEHKIEKANSPQKEEADTKKIVVKGQEVQSQIYSNINQEIVEKRILFKDGDELPITKIVEKEILDAYQDISEIENESKKTTFLSKLFSAKIPQKKGNTILVSSDSEIKSDIVFVKLDESLDLIQAEEKLAEKEKDGKDLDEKRLLIYAELIAKIPKEYSDSISSIHQEIISLKKQEKDHKKTLVFLTPIIKKEEEEQKRIAKEITEQERILCEIASEIASEEKRYFAEVEEAKRVAEVEEAKRVAEVEEAKRVAEVEEAKRFAEEQKPIETEELENKISQVEQDLIQTKTYIESNIREILSSKYVDERLASYPEKSIIDQFLIEAIIVDEAKKQFTPEEIEEIKIQQHHPGNTSLEAFNLHVLKKALEKKFESEQKAMEIVGEAVVIKDVSAINITQTKIAFYKTQNHLYEKHDKIRALEYESEQLKISLYHLKIALERQQNPINPEILTLLPESPSTTDANTNSSWVDQQLAASRGEAIGEDRGQFPRSESQTYFTETIWLPNQLSSQNRILGLQESAIKGFQDLEPQPPPPPLETFQSQNSFENIEQSRGELGLSAQQSYVPPPPPRDENSSRDEFQASIIPSLNLDLDGVEQNIPPTKLRTKEGKKQFWQTFISTRLATRTSTPIQYSPRNNEYDQNQNQFDEPQSNSATLESGSLEGSSTPRSTSSYLTTEKGKTDEIEERKKRLYTILLANLKEQITKESGADSNNIMQSYPISKDEEEINAETTENNIEIVMTHIATYTSNLASSISKVENKQTEGAHQSEASDSQMIQNSSNEDPIIYSGIGIRIKLEKEGENLSLKITEVFENSGIDQGDVNKKITHIKCGDELKSITAIYEDCGGDEEKFYTKIALIFRDEKQEKLTLKIDDEEKTVGKNIFIPEDKTVLNVTKNSQMTKIAEKLRASRQTFSQLTTPRRGERTNSLTNPI